MKELTKGMAVTVRVKGMKVFALRLWLTMRLLGLVSWLSPVKVIIETTDGYLGAPPRRKR